MQSPNKQKQLQLTQFFKSKDNITSPQKFTTLLKPQTVQQTPSHKPGSLSLFNKLHQTQHKNSNTIINSPTKESLIPSNNTSMISSNTHIQQNMQTDKPEDDIDNFLLSKTQPVKRTREQFEIENNDLLQNNTISFDDAIKNKRFRTSSSESQIEGDKPYQSLQLQQQKPQLTIDEQKKPQQINLNQLISPKSTQKQAILSPVVQKQTISFQSKVKQIQQIQQEQQQTDTELQQSSNIEQYLSSQKQVSKQIKQKEIVNPPISIFDSYIPSITQHPTQSSDTSDKQEKNEDRYQWLENPLDLQKRPRNHPNYDPSTLYIPMNAFSRLTPMEKQYWAIKQHKFDYILFFQKGKFYELYEQDADVAAKELELKMTGRINMRMCGVPETKFAEWAKKLLKKGYKVARVDEIGKQGEDEDEDNDADQEDDDDSEKDDDYQNDEDKYKYSRIHKKKEENDINQDNQLKKQKSLNIEDNTKYSEMTLNKDNNHPPLSNKQQAASQSKLNELLSIHANNQSHKQAAIQAMANFESGSNKGKASSIQNRELAQIYTRGTLFDPEMLDSDETSLLICICEGPPPAAPFFSSYNSKSGYDNKRNNNKYKQQKNDVSSPFSDRSPSISGRTPLNSSSFDNDLNDQQTGFSPQRAKASFGICVLDAALCEFSVGVLADDSCLTSLASLLSLNPAREALLCHNTSTEENNSLSSIQVPQTSDHKPQSNKKSKNQSASTPSSFFQNQSVATIADIFSSHSALLTLDHLRQLLTENSTVTVRDNSFFSLELGRALVDHALIREKERLFLKKRKKKSKKKEIEGTNQQINDHEIKIDQNQQNTPQNIPGKQDDDLYQLDNKYTVFLNDLLNSSSSSLQSPISTSTHSPTSPTSLSFVLKTQTSLALRALGACIGYLDELSLAPMILPSCKLKTIAELIRIGKSETEYNKKNKKNNYDEFDNSQEDEDEVSNDDGCKELILDAATLTNLEVFDLNKGSRGSIAAAAASAISTDSSPLQQSSHESQPQSQSTSIPGTLWHILDHSLLPEGRRMLRKWVCHPLRQPFDIEQRLDCVETIINVVEGVKINSGLKMEINKNKKSAFGGKNVQIKGKGNTNKESNQQSTKISNPKKKITKKTKQLNKLSSMKLDDDDDDDDDDEEEDNEEQDQDEQEDSEEQQSNEDFNQNDEDDKDQKDEYIQQEKQEQEMINNCKSVGEALELALFLLS